MQRKGQKGSTTRAFQGDVSDFRQDDCPSLLVTDVRLRSCQLPNAEQISEFLMISSLWNVSTAFESFVLSGIPPIEQSKQASRLSRQGYRPVVISAELDPGTRKTITASIWHRPRVSEAAKDQIARRQANAAVALLRLKQDRRVWPMLQHRPDPRARSYLIHRLYPLGADARQLIKELGTQGDDSIRRSLILGLGEFDQQRFTAEERAEVVENLLDLYANDADSGIHGAAAWTLRQWERSSDVDTSGSRTGHGSYRRRPPLVCEWTWADARRSIVAGGFHGWIATLGRRS